ncbi:MAG: methionine synthase [Lachnospiraceae bacterium]|nr:methionine synthase [Lachnospiraceae bacterium]
MQIQEIELKAVNRAEAYRYMGFGNTEPDENIMKIIDEKEKELLGVMRPKFIFDCFDINKNDKGVELIGTTLTLKGEAVSNHLKDCDKAVIMCATISQDVDKLIRQNEISNIFGALVLDGLANAAVEQLCDVAELFISATMPEYNRTWRFGVGYGDFPMDTQKEFLNILNAPKYVGVCANDNNILTPRKSVTCVIGLSKKEVDGEASCSKCNFKDKCAISKEGGSCGGKQ